MGLWVASDSFTQMLSCLLQKVVKLKHVCTNRDTKTKASFCLALVPTLLIPIRGLSGSYIKKAALKMFVQLSAEEVWKS